MGCGKSKHDVASDNTLQRKKSPEPPTENGTENKVDNVVISSEVEQNNNNQNVKEVDVGGNKVDESNDVKDKCLGDVEENRKDAEENTQEDVVHAPVAAVEEKKPENIKEEVEIKDTVQGKTLTKEEESKDTNKEETLANKEEEESKDTNQTESLVIKEEETKETIVPTYEGEQKI